MVCGVIIGFAGSNKAFWIEDKVCVAFASRAADMPDH
jgi:hypothetical protein